MVLETVGFIVLGVAIGTIGTLIGAGGGFILLPVLALLYPLEPTGTLTATTLAVVAANATSGAIAYGRQGRIDLRAGSLFALATLPGGIAGVMLGRTVPRGPFDVAFALVLFALALVLVRLEPERSRPAAARRRLLLGMAISFVIGFASSLLGIGGGFIHVPVLIAVLGFPVHIATATSHYVLAISATVGTLTHLLAGDLSSTWPRTVAIASGAIVGAQLGAVLSRRVHGGLIVRILALALVVVALRLAAQGLLGL